MMDFGGQQQGIIHVPADEEELEKTKVYVWDSTTFWSKDNKKSENKESKNKEEKKD